MHTIDFWFDPISPYAHLAFHRLPQALQGISHGVRYRPVLFAGLLKHHGQLGPAEIPGKRAWTYRQVIWLGRELGIPLQMPAAHPFNPLPLLRLLLACAAPDGCPNRWQVEQVLAHVWQSDGADPADPARLEALRQRLHPTLDPEGPEVKTRLVAEGEAALAAGVFGVPSLVAKGRLFWGLDGLPMLAQALQGDAWFDGAAWVSAPDWPVGAGRKRP